MMEMAKSTVVEEAVSGAVSFVFRSRGDKVSQKDLMERLEMVHIKLDFALERSRMTPITVVSLLRLKKKLKDVFEECDDLLGKARDRQKVVPSFRTKIMHAMLPPFVVPNQDMLSSSVVGRFERFAMEADRFVRDLESGCSLSHYRFLNPLIRHLLEGKKLSYHKLQVNQTCSLLICTAFLEEYGIVAGLYFEYKDRKAPLKCFQLALALRLYESTNIIGVAAKCLQSLGPQFKSLAEVATGVLTQVPTQDVSFSDLVHRPVWDHIVKLISDPFCCIPNGLNKLCANNIISSELTGRFPQEVMLVGFRCCFLASECCFRSSTNEACINTIKSWPPLDMLVWFAPHVSRKLQDGGSLHETEEGIQTKAIDYLIRHPELMKYHRSWCSVLVTWPCNL